MPLVAVFIVLLSIALMFLYDVPAVRARLTDYAKNLTVREAATAAEVLSETEDQQDFRHQLELSAETTGGEIIVVDKQGRIVAREGSMYHFEPTQEMLRRASTGGRMFDKVDGLNVAVVPLVTDGTLSGGVVLASDEPENVAYQLFLRSGLEAAALASVLGGGLMLLLATLLSQRVERLTLGAQAIEQGDFSSRIEPGFDDELGKLAKSFNTMAARLEDSFSQLEEKSSTLDAIVNNLTEGVLATDLKGNVVFANRSARAMLGTGEEALGKVPGPWKDFDLPEAVARCARQRECGEARVHDEETFLQVKVEHLPAFDEHRGGVLVVMQDLSEGRRLEANQQRFLANAAHELKTPITTILGASELLLTGDEEVPELRRRFLKHIHSEAERMQYLSETLLRLARTGTDLREPELEALDLEDPVRETVERMRPLVEAAELALHVEVRGGRVRADREWLEQVLLILLNNAVQHSGGGNVWLRAGDGKVVVEDDGAGIAGEDLPYVFERFYRGEGSTGGFGLGLPICKELVERMGGIISIDSQEGIGTTVEIDLPEVQDG